MEIRFDGKKALVTGAGRGIGRDIAKALLRCGAEVYALSRSQEPLETLKAECPGIHLVCCDLSDWATTRSKVEALGHIHLLVNNAGIMIDKPFLEFTSEDFDKVMSVNLKAVINVSQVVAKTMISCGSGGSIVNVSSQAGLRGLHARGVYGASKAGLDQLTRVMSLELGPHQIRVNSVNPTLVLTDLGKQLWCVSERAEAMANLMSRLSLGKLAEVEDITGPVLFLLSDLSAMIHGAVLPIDGGYTAV